MNHKTKTDVLVDEGYNVTVTGRHLSITDAMKNYAMEKVSKLERFSPRLIDLAVTMDIQKLEHRVDIVLRFNNIKIKSHASTTDMYASIDMAVDKLQTQLRRYKNKLQNHHTKSLNMIDLNVNVVRPHREDEISEVNGDIEEANNASLVARYRPILWWRKRRSH